jgi:hypothetical protein
MKKINTLHCLLFAFVTISLLFTACQEEDLTYQSGDAFHFTAESINTSENSVTPVIIPIVYTKTSAVAGSVTVSITSATATEGVDYIVLNPSMTFDFTADQYHDTLLIQPIDNSLLEEDKVIDITFSSGSAALGYPGLEGGTSFDSLALTLQDDDCAILDLGGTYSVTSTYGFHDFLPDYTTNTMQMAVISNGDGTYSPEDFSGGLYGSGPYVAAYGTTPIADVAISELCGAVSWSGASDPWGDLVMTPGGVNEVNASGVMTLSWTALGYGENAVSIYAPQ